ncbi:MAG: alcohol dehydrogenase catalytic domain-containing protein [Spirochaetia bacterium]|jgi:L-iditol 2-dehydrogenase
MKGTMKAQVFYEPLKMRLEEVSIPTVQADQVLIRVRACGICGSDNAYYRGKSPLETPSGKGPIILGHEFSGEVVELGSIPAEAKLFKVGDRVTVNPVQYCGACPRCLRGQFNMCEHGGGMGGSLNGAFAEYTVSKYQNLWKLPDDISFEVGAVAEPLACGTYGVMNMHIHLGDIAAVIGPGPIGSMMVRLIKAMGASKVFLIGSRDYRLDAGRPFGADMLINTVEKDSPYYVPDLVKCIEEQTGGTMVNCVITATASLVAMQQALDISAKASTVVFFGLPGEADEVRVPALKSIFGDKTIRFSWLAPTSWPTATQALFTRLLDPTPLITHTFPLADLALALDFVRDRRERVMKALIIPSK